MAPRTAHSDSALRATHSELPVLGLLEEVLSQDLFV